MRSNICGRRSSFFFLLLSCSILTFQISYAAGSGTIKGRILAKATGNILSGANIVVKNTSLGAASDLDGKYIIHNVPEGKQTLRISYIGYLSITVDVDIVANKELEQDFSLSAQAVAGETVVIRGQAQGQLAAINEQLSSNRIINVVSSEKMRELPDANLAESIGRLPGVSLGRTAGEADKVIIRGLDAKFNKVTIEGVPMVSTSGGRASGNGVPSGMGGSNYSDRSIDLSLIGDDLVKAVEVSKSLRADMDADAIGGTINLTLKEAPEGFNYDVQGNGAYNRLTENYKNYKISGNVSNRFFGNAIGLRLQLHAEDKALPSQQFNAGYDGVTTNTIKDPATGIVSVELIRKTNSSRYTVDEMGRKRYGGSIIMDYKSDFVDLILLNLYSQKNDHDKRYDMNVNFQATGDNLFSRYYTVSDFKTEERTHSLQSKFRFFGTELKTSLSYTKGNYSNPGVGFPFMEVNTPNLFGPDDFTFADPASLIAKAGSDNPNNTALRNIDYIDNSLKDNTYDVKADYNVPFKLSDVFSGKISLGGKYHEFDRSNRGTSTYYNMEWGGSVDRKMAFVKWLTDNIDPRASEYGVDAERGVIGLTFMNYGYMPPEFLNGKYKLDSWGYDIGLLKRVADAWYDLKSGANYIDGAQSYNSDYDETEKLGAGYLMGEFNVGSRLTIIPGLRYEDLRGTYEAYAVYTNNSNQDGLQGQAPIWRTISASHGNYFPSATVKFKASENVQFLGAYYRSATRPEFSALSPLIDYPTVGNLNASSNPFLKPAFAQNFDVGASLFSNKIGLFTVNVYYKELEDLIYSIPGYKPYLRRDIINAPADMLDRLPGLAYFDSTWFKVINQNATTSIPINNPEKAIVRGIEFSWQTRLWYLPGVLSGIVLDLNVALIDSKTNYPYFQTVNWDTIWNAAHTRPVKINTREAYKTRSGALTNQPKAIYNAILGWDYKGFSSRVSARYQQKTLTSLDSKYSLADSYYDNVLLIDVALKQRIVENVAVFASFTNVNSHVDDYYYASPKGNLSTSSQTYGLNAQFGVSYSLK
jgi:TonB-dependent receptor